LRYSKLRITAEATSRIRTIRQRTLLPPNLLCRIGLMLSLDEGPLNGVTAADEEGTEFNAYTLTGANEEAFFALLRFVEEEAEGAPLPDAELVARLRAHIHRGLGTLVVRAKGPLEIARLARSA
jgi:DNA sulfur modification protein DndE